MKTLILGTCGLLLAVLLTTASFHPPRWNAAAGDTGSTPLLSLKHSVQIGEWEGISKVQCRFCSRLVPLKGDHEHIVRRNHTNTMWNVECHVHVPSGVAVKRVSNTLAVRAADDSRYLTVHEIAALMPLSPYTTFALGWVSRPFTP